VGNAEVREDREDGFRIGDGSDRPQPDSADGTLECVDAVGAPQEHRRVEA
jgi:hypothetical protein